MRFLILLFGAVVLVSCGHPQHYVIARDDPDQVARCERQKQRDEEFEKYTFERWRIKSDSYFSPGAQFERCLKERVLLPATGLYSIGGGGRVPITCSSNAIGGTVTTFCW